MQIREDRARAELDGTPEAVIASRSPREGERGPEPGGGRDEFGTSSCSGPLWGNSDRLVGDGPSPTRAQTTVASANISLPIQNAAGLQLLVAIEHIAPFSALSSPVTRRRDRLEIEILFPEHVTAVKQGQRSSQQLYLFSPGRSGDQPLWRRSGASLEYERDLRRCSPARASHAGERRRALPL